MQILDSRHNSREKALQMKMKSEMKMVNQTSRKRDWGRQIFQGDEKEG